MTRVEGQCRPSYGDPDLLRARGQTHPTIIKYHLLRKEAAALVLAP